MNRADWAIPGQWKGTPGTELLGVIAPALPPWLVTCAFPSYAAPVVLSHTEIQGVISPHGVC